MAYSCVRVLFEIGHEASIRANKTPEGFTHDWELFVRGADHTEIHHFVEKVIFYLHDTFQNPKRVIKEPPYVVRETGYAGFPLIIEIYLKNKHDPSKIKFNYEITFPTKGSAISNVKKERYVFKNPSEDFRRKLIRGGGVGVGAESASGSHANHMAALNSSDHSTDDHKSFNNKNKGSPQDVIAAKKSKKENTPKNEEQLSANDPFSIFGQPIKTSKIPLVSKSSSKQQISDKQPPTQEKQSHSSKSSKHSSSSHKDKDKDKERSSGGGAAGAPDKDRSGSKEKDKTKDKEKEKDKNSLRRSKDEPKKEKVKDDKVRILKVSKDDSKKNSYHEEKAPKEKPSLEAKSLDRASSGGSGAPRGSADKELKFEKKDKEKKRKEEKKSKSKDKYKQNEKKENIDVVKESYVNDRSEKLFSNKDDYKEEKKFHRIITMGEKEEKADKIAKDKGNSNVAEPKSLFNNVNNNNNSNSNNNNLDNQIMNGEVIIRKEEKHKHHKHKKDKSKKDGKRDKEERKDKKESKENKERVEIPAPAPLHRSTPKSESPRRLKKPLKTLFEELPDASDSDLSSLDDPHPRLHKEASSPEMSIVKEEPIGYRHEEQTKDVHETGSKKKKKNNEERENKKRKRKSKDKEDVSNKMIKYESNAAELEKCEIPEGRPKSVSPVSETKFTDEYITKLRELQRKIMTLEDNTGLQRIVQVVAETGQYEITTKTFDFDLCTLDESIVQRLLDFFVP